MKATAAAAAAAALAALLPFHAGPLACEAVTVRRAAPDGGPPPTTGLEAAKSLEECLVVPQSLCLQDDLGKSFVIGRSHFPIDLQLWYQFDESLPVDSSGQMQHLTNEDYVLKPLTVGPGVMGRGASASFDGRSYRALRDTKALDNQAFTIAMWIYLREDAIGSWRTIYSRGSRPEEMMPALLLYPDERRLHLRFAERADAGGAALDGKGLLPIRRWTHVAAVSTGSVLRLFINGVVDNEIIIEDPPGSSEAPFHLGRDPWRAGTKAFVDDFRWYSRALHPDELRAMLFPSLTGAAGADSVSLGCMSCRFPEATKSCPRRKHLCTLEELFSGGFHTARALGWLTASSEVWFQDEAGADLFNGREKMGLCCAD